jgi:hypothetical protein
MHMSNNEPEASKGKAEHKGVFSRLTAWLTGAAALLAAIAAILGALGKIDFSPVFKLVSQNGPKMTIVDAEYAVLRDASIWQNPDIIATPIGRLEPGSFVRVRGRVDALRLYAIELPSRELGYVSSDHLIEAAAYRAKRATESTALQHAVGSQKQGEFLFGIRASASWEADASIYEKPDAESNIVGRLTAGRKIGHDTFNGGEVGVIDRIKDGKWIEVGIEGRSMGFVYSRDVTELWPTGVITYTDTGEEVIAKLQSSAGFETKVRRGPTYLRMETKVKCEEEVCSRISLYSSVDKKPNGPSTYTGHRIVGSWRKGEEIEIYAILPLEFLTFVGNDLYYCIGTPSRCRPSKVLRVSAPGIVLEGKGG